MRNGCTKVEIREILLQVAICAGVRASNDSFRAAREVFDIMDAEAKAPSKSPINK
jgi:4-carboxymuconolactone decarboxylase